MERYCHKPIEVLATQITAEVFDDPHPNASRIADPRIVYDSVRRCVYVQTPLDGTERADIGDWIVRTPNGQLSRWDNRSFRETYEAPDGRKGLS